MLLCLDNALKQLLQLLYVTDHFFRIILRLLDKDENLEQQRNIKNGKCFKNTLQIQFSNTFFWKKNKMKKLK